MHSEEWDAADRDVDGGLAVRAQADERTDRGGGLGAAFDGGAVGGCDHDWVLIDMPDPCEISRRHLRGKKPATCRAALLHEQQREGGCKQASRHRLLRLALRICADPVSRARGCSILLLIVQSR